MKNIAFSNRGLTLPELIMSVFVLALALVGVILSYVNCMELNELSKNQTIANHVINSRIEQIKDTAFAQIKATYHGVTFTTPGINGIGVGYVDDTNSQLLLVTISFCWKQSNGRVIGEDKNLNGVLNAGEDANANGMIDSKVQLTSCIYGT